MQFFLPAFLRKQTKAVRIIIKTKQYKKPTYPNFSHNLDENLKFIWCDLILSSCMGKSFRMIWVIQMRENMFLCDGRILFNINHCALRKIQKSLFKKSLLSYSDNMLSLKHHTLSMDQGLQIYG